MPGFTLPGGELDSVVAFVRGLLAPASANPAPGDPVAGKCSSPGKEGAEPPYRERQRSGAGPGTLRFGKPPQATEIELALANPSETIVAGFQAVTVTTKDGRTLRGIVKNESDFDLQLQGLDGHFHMLRRQDITELRRGSQSLMPPLSAQPAERQNLLAFLTRLPRPDALAHVPAGKAPANGGLSFEAIARPAPGEWPTYDGSLTGNRHSPLTQITRANVHQLGARWMYTIPNTRLQESPIVAQGVMYITHGNEVHELRIWAQAGCCGAGAAPRLRNWSVIRSADLVAGWRCWAIASSSSDGQRAPGGAAPS